MEAYYEKDGYTLYNGDCIEAMDSMEAGSVDIVITSPPYGTCRNETFSKESNQKRKYNMRYDEFTEGMPPAEYCRWTVDVFNAMDRVLKQNRVVLYNFGLGNDAHTDYTNYDWFKAVTEVIDHTPFTVADMLVWRKKCALPNNVSPNKSTRICEPVVVFCRRGQESLFPRNSSQGNMFEARNNDGSCELNKATFSTQFVQRLVGMYVPDSERRSWTVLDPFHGTGTTGVVAIEKEMRYVGVELSKAQCDYSIARIEKGVQLDLF